MPLQRGLACALDLAARHLKPTRCSRAHGHRIVFKWLCLPLAHIRYSNGPSTHAVQSMMSSATVSAACPMPRDCVNCLMPNSIFRCPNTGLNVPRPFVPDPDADPNFYEHVPCPACGQSHLMHKSTGELIGEPREE